ncbi:hypothetical protein HRbin36_02330 [bacterium HR36]|nr:hypothetical protein HRbin36_02330 [bacterium HR36]
MLKQTHQLLPRCWNFPRIPTGQVFQQRFDVAAYTTDLPETRFFPGRSYIPARLADRISWLGVSQLVIVGLLFLTTTSRRHHQENNNDNGRNHEQATADEKQYLHLILLGGFLRFFRLLLVGLFGVRGGLFFFL